MRNPKYPVPQQTVWTRKRTKPEKISGSISSEEQVRYTNESLDQGMEVEDSGNYCDTLATLKLLVTMKLPETTMKLPLAVTMKLLLVTMSV